MTIKQMIGYQDYGKKHVRMDLLAVMIDGGFEKGYSVISEMRMSGKVMLLRWCKGCVIEYRG